MCIARSVSGGGCGSLRSACRVAWVLLYNRIEGGDVGWRALERGVCERWRVLERGKSDLLVLLIVVVPP
jgi:hypothetical protein